MFFCRMSEKKPIFALKNILSEKFIHPTNQGNLLRNDDLLVLWNSIHDNTTYIFDQVDGQWGYIRHIKSGMVWHPYGGPSKSTTRGTKICLHSDRGRHALWALDQVNNHIVHRDGFYVHYHQGQNPYPPNGDTLVLWDEVHGGMKWKFVNPDNLKEEVRPYGLRFVF